MARRPSCAPSPASRCARIAARRGACPRRGAAGACPPRSSRWRAPDLTPLPAAPAQTIRFKSELVRNITIKLGYANAKIYCSEAPGAGASAGAGASGERVYESKGSSHPDTYTLEDGSGRAMHLVRHVSFVGA